MDVKIRIREPILRSYLAGLFEKREDGYAVNMNSITGSVIISLVSAAARPPKIDADRSVVTFHLPSSHYTSRLRNKFLVVDRDAEDKINAVLKREFDVNFLSYCTELRIMGYQLKDIIAMFIVENGMDDMFDGDIEALKKRYYRRELEILNQTQEKLRAKAYSARRKIRKSVPNECI